MTLRKAGIVTVIGLCAAAPAAAQVRPAAPASVAQTQARRDIGAFEGVLESAVSNGAQKLMQHVQTSNVPDMVMLTGMARARGFRLDGYGVVFDVEFPSIRRSVMWSMRALQRPDRQLLDAMREMRKGMVGPEAEAARQAMDQDIKALEADIRANDQRGAVTAASSGTSRAASDPQSDPKGFYQNEITNALVDAMLDQGAPIGVGADEWLTVAARESADRGFAPNDPNGTAMTFILRIKGSDLKALQERRLTRDEARRKVEIAKY